MLAVGADGPGDVGEIGLAVVILEDGHIAHEGIVNERLIHEGEWAFGLVGKGEAQMGAVAVVFEDHHVFLRELIVEDIHAVGVDGEGEDDAFVFPVDQIGGGVAGLIAKAAGAAVPVEFVIEPAEAAAAGLDAVARSSVQ